MADLRALCIASLLALVPLAGCAGDDPQPAAKSDPIKPASSGGSGTSSGAPTTVTPPPPPKPRGTSERWHFHDYWLGQPTITLLTTNVTLNLTQAADGLPALGAIVELPHGTIVPPETGFLTFNVTWAGQTSGLVNLTYKPADSNDFFTGGDLERAVPLIVNTTESNCDVPHRQVSAWKFNLTAKPGGTPPTLPPREVELTVTATIGRPLFIDPPHLNWWRDGEVIPLVTNVSGDVRAAKTPAANLTLPGKPPEPSATPSAPRPEGVMTTHRVTVDAGRIVPEGAKTIVAILNWSSPVEGATLQLRYRENNYPSEGPLEVAQEAPGSRVYILPVAQAQTDTTYSNRTTWEFHVLPEGGPAAAFEGSFTLVAWVAKHDPAAAIAAILGPDV